MKLTPILFALALLVFILALFEVTIDEVNLTLLGLALQAAGFVSMTAEPLRAMRR